MTRRTNNEYLLPTLLSRPAQSDFLQEILLSDNETGQEQFGITNRLRFVEKIAQICRVKSPKCLRQFHCQAIKFRVETD